MFDNNINLKCIRKNNKYIYNIYSEYIKLSNYIYKMIFRYNNLIFGNVINWKLEIYI